MMIKRWDIYRANLDPIIGSEQGKTRPVLVISNDAINNILNIVNVIFYYIRKPGRIIYPNEVDIPVNTYGLQNESIVLCQQIRTLDKQRLSFNYGRQIQDTTIKKQIISALCFQLGI